MTERRKRLEGYTFVANKRGGSWHLRLNQYETTRLAWLKGAQYVDAEGFYGERLTIKLDEVDGIAELTAEVLQASIDDGRQNESDDSLAGSA